MGHQLTRRTFVLTGTAAGLALATLGGPAIAAAQDSDKPKVAVGSKDFTESVVLAEIVALILEDAGYEVVRELNLGGTAVVHEAIVNGDVDAYVEYTGTALLAILGEELPEITDSATPTTDTGVDPVYDIVAEKYQEQFGLEWLKPWGFNNTYALAMRADDVEEMGISTISELKEFSSDLSFGATQEFLVREDGLPGIEELYDISFGDAVGLDPGLMYSALDGGQVDVISAFATDGRVPALGLVLLEDDLGFFPPYFAAPVIRQDLLEASPEVADVLNQLAGQITDEMMADLNFKVDDGGEEAIDVARAFLEEEGYIGG